MERLLPFVVAAVCFVVALMVPSSAPRPQPEPAPPPTTTTTIPPTPNARVNIGSVTIHSAGAAVDELAAAVEDQVVATLEDYLRVGLLLPLAGTVDPDPGALFTTQARRQLAGTDRAVLIAAGARVPEGRRWVRLGGAKVDLSVLVGAAGEVGAVVATIDWEATAHGTAGDSLRLRRTGELTLIPDGDRWRIDAYALDLEQMGTGPTTTTTVDEERPR